MNLRYMLSVAVLAVTLASLIFLMYLPGMTYSVNCMWDDSCEGQKYNINFCGNGYCEPFESKEKCLEDCGTILDVVLGKIQSFFSNKESSGGPFGGIADSGVMVILVLIGVMIIFVVVGIVLITVYNKIVASIEKEVIPS